jgi:hypothetical protein
VVLRDVELSKSMVNTGAATKRYVIETSDFVAPLNPGIPTTLIHSDLALANDTTATRLDIPRNVAAQEGASRRVSCHRRLGFAGSGATPLVGFATPLPRWSQQTCVSVRTLQSRSTTHSIKTSM